MAQIEKSIVHLTMRFEKKILAIGTGMFYKNGDEYYIITAWHNVSGRHTETLECLDKINKATPDNIIVNFFFNMSGNYIRMTALIPLFDDSMALYLIHPQNWPRVDIVAIPFKVYEPIKTEIYTPDGKYQEFLFDMNKYNDRCPIHPAQDFITISNAADKWIENVDVTEEVFIPGYPQNITDSNFLPVWKRATIASRINRNWNGERKYLIDSASSGGMSGAPVFYYNPNGIIQTGGVTAHHEKEVTILAGIYVGRIGVNEKNDPQIGTVWHPSLIDEIIAGKRCDFLSYDIIVGPRKLESEFKKLFATYTKETVQNILNESSLARFYTLNEVLSLIEGRYNKKDLLAELICFAENYQGPYSSRETVS